MFGNLSGAHFNPAISIAFALFRPSEMKLTELFGFIVAQYVGGILGVGMIATFYRNSISQYEDDYGLPYRGEGSIGPLALYWADGLNEGDAFLAEFWGSFVLSMNVFFLTSERMKTQFSSKNGVFFPIYIGVILYLLINVIGFLTGCGKYTNLMDNSSFFSSTHCYSSILS